MAMRTAPSNTLPIGLDVSVPGLGLDLLDALACVGGSASPFRHKFTVFVVITDRRRELQNLREASHQRAVFLVGPERKPRIRHPLDGDVDAFPNALHAERRLGANAVQVNRT